MLSRCSASQNQVTTGAELCRVESVGLQSSKNSPSRDHIVGGGALHPRVTGKQNQSTKKLCLPLQQKLNELAHHRHSNFFFFNLGEVYPSEDKVSGIHIIYFVPC